MVTPAKTSPTAVPTGAPAPKPAKARDLIGPSAKVVPIKPIAAGVTLYRSVSHSSLCPSSEVIMDSPRIRHPGERAKDEQLYFVLSQSHPQEHGSADS